jgi:DNA-binding MarR family transcriptional regulator
MAAGTLTDVQSVVHLLHRAGQRADELFARRGGELTPRQYEILRVVAHADGLSQTAIMTATGIDRSSTAELVRRLARRGLPHRRRIKRDTRVYAVRLTPKGHQALDAAEPLARAADNALLSSLSSSQTATFLEALALVAMVGHGPARRF